MVINIDLKQKEINTKTPRLTENRLNQGLEKVFGINGRLDVKKTGEFLKWLVSDITREEMDTLSKNGLEPKDVTSTISKRGKDWFFGKLSEF